MKRLMFIAILVAGFAPAPLVAQYAVLVSDTLPCSEVTNGSVGMALPNGTATVRTLHDALVAVTFTAVGGARAWYDAVSQLETRIEPYLGVSDRM